MSNDAVQVAMNALQFKHQLAKNESAKAYLGYSGGFFEDVFNPLSVFRLMCLDHKTESCIDDIEAAKVLGVDPRVFHDETLSMPFDEVVRCMGLLSLMFLASARNEVRSDGGFDGHEPLGGAVDAAKSLHETVIRLAGEGFEPGDALGMFRLVYMAKTGELQN